MKKTAENRYPHSATLFKFCKEALGLHFNGNVKVIDQDVGAILGYDPADCSHWKKGKKNIKALGTLRAIATHLGIDEYILIGVASGKLTLEEALFEYKGYGDFFLNASQMETFRKDYYLHPEKWQRQGKAVSFEELTHLDQMAIADCAHKIIADAKVKEPPIYIPELYQLFPNISLEHDETIQKTVDSSSLNEVSGHVKVYYKNQEIKPHVRFLLAKELFFSLIKQHHEVVANIKEAPDFVRNIQANLFAAHLLIPDVLLKLEVQTLGNAVDLVIKLAENFWVSKALINQRLRNYLGQFH